MPSEPDAIGWELTMRSRLGEELRRISAKVHNRVADSAQAKIFAILVDLSHCTTTFSPQDRRISVFLSQRKKATENYQKSSTADYSFEMAGSVNPAIELGGRVLPQAKSRSMARAFCESLALHTRSSSPS